MDGFDCLFLVGVLLGWVCVLVWWVLTGVIVIYFCTFWSDLTAGVCLICAVWCFVFWCV